MPTNYPTAIDDNTSMPSKTDAVDDVTAADHNTQNGAIKAIENAVGLPSGATAGSLYAKYFAHDHLGTSGESQDVRIGRVFELRGVTSPAQITADQNNYAPAIAQQSVLRLSTDAARNITGIAGATNGKLLLVQNIGTFNIVLKNASASSTAANRFAFGADITVVPGQGILLYYDNTQSRWVNPSTSVTDHSLLTNVTADQHHLEIHGRAKHTTAVRVSDEGGAFTDILDFDFAGSGVSVAFASGKATVTIPGGGVGSLALTDLTDVDSAVATAGNTLFYQEDPDGIDPPVWTPGMPETNHGNFSHLNSPEDHPWAAQVGHGHTLEELFGFVRKYKSADQSLTVSSTTFQDVADMNFSIGTNEIWFFEAMLRMNAANITMDAKFTWTVPSGTTMDWGIVGNGTSITTGFMTGAAGQTATGFLAAGDTLTTGSSAGANYGIFFMGWIYASSTAGTVQLRSAQATSDAGVLKVLSHSMLRLWRQEG